jgi:transcriptional regulator
MSDQELAGNLDALSAKFESWLAPKPPWAVGEMSAGRREMLMKAIVGLKMTVENVEGSFKLNQHKADADHAAIADALASQADAGAQAIGKRMIALRPQLDYKSVMPVGGPADGRNAP